MLSDHERKTLREVERRFVAEDPEFARCFEARQTGLSNHHHKLGVRIALVTAALLTALILVAGSLVGALVFAVATWLLWAAWRHSAETERQGP